MVLMNIAAGRRKLDDMLQLYDMEPGGGSGMQVLAQCMGLKGLDTHLAPKPF